MTLPAPAADLRTVRVRLFAAAKDRAGAEFVTARLPADATIGDLRAALAETVPPLRSLSPHLLFAIGIDYATEETPVPAGKEVVVFPPVSGG